MLSSSHLFLCYEDTWPSETETHVFAQVVNVMKDTERCR